ncbi:MAG: hypothetical protein K0Q47_150 [Sedimentibacter sp.]|jgi:hypothetical protein|nr:hypothetical protein [Sedimentibacter sp.]
MADFSIEDRFKKEAAFSSVKFGGDSYILGEELNEMQEIMRERIRSIFRNYFGDGVFGTGTLNYNAETKEFSIEDESVVIDGEIIYIKNMVLENVEEGAIIYLEVWDEEANFNSTLKKWGNQQSDETVENTMLDPRVLEETTRRMVLCNRLTLDNSNENHRFIRLAHIEDGFAETDAVSIGGMVNRHGDQMQGVLKANNNNQYNVPQVRNFVLSTDPPTDDIGQNGDIWLMYE